VLNGPNLDRLGKREPDVYGTATHAELVAACEQEAQSLGISVDVRQTDDESTYLGWIHAAADGAADGLVLNPAAWTHTSVAVRDAAAELRVPYVEVHLSNPLAREEFRHTSYTAGHAMGVVAGFGVDSYRLALRGLAARITA
jgi:3-dehydroquinate dehydratase-2